MRPRLVPTCSWGEIPDTCRLYSLQYSLQEYILLCRQELTVMTMVASQLQPDVSIQLVRPVPAAPPQLAWDQSSQQYPLQVQRHM